MKPIKSMLLFLGKNFLTGFIIMLWALVALLGVQAFQSLTTNPSTSGNQSLGSPILTKSGWTFNRDVHSLEAIARFLWIGYTQGIKRMFITSQTYNGNLWWLSGADAKCQAAANSASLWGNWMAVLTDGTNHFTTRAPDSEKYYYVNLFGQPIFTNGLPWLFNKTSQRKSPSDYITFNNITYENKTFFPFNSLTWSNISENWNTAGSSWNCNWWTIDSWNAGYYWYLHYTSIDGVWNPSAQTYFYYYSTSTCQTLYPLRCIEI